MTKKEVLRKIEEAAASGQKELRLIGANIKELPPEIVQLTNLRILALQGNQFSELPPEIGRLTQLERLYLHDNQLTELPVSMRGLGALELLTLHGNRALDMPAEVLGPTWREIVVGKSPAKPSEILGYYFRIRSERRPLNEAKLILVGRGEVGKTSLVNMLVHNQFAPKEAKTPGISITEWTRKISGEDIKLNIWDFGGQEIMHATHQFFMTQRSLYMVVLNGREGGEDADAEYWLQLINSFAPDSPVIVVLNKVKMHPFDLNRGALKQKFTSVRGFIKTDCAGPSAKDRRKPVGITRLRRKIERETDRLEHLRDPFPASWFDIKNRLAGMGEKKENFVSYDRFREICRELGEEDSEAQESLAFYLHTLGIALNYKEDPRIRDMHVLNPHWVTNGIYKILNAGKLEKRHGELHISDLGSILKKRDYPTERHGFLLNLMRKFELCFTFPEDDCRYLVPQLLVKNEASEAAEFKAGDCLNFEYQYPILPEGLLPRFIVRTHALSVGLPRWRSGVILKFERNKALVKADGHDRKVRVSVKGSKTGRQRLLAVIRSDFDRIHSSFEFEPEEMVPLPEHPQHAVPYQELRVYEAEGVTTFTRVIGGEVIELNVQELLNGVDVAGARADEKGRAGMSARARLFYSYSHKDERLRLELETHLKILERERLIDPWHDRNIDAGEDWKTEIDRNLERADIILLLVSADFIASDYCWEKEMKRALEREADEEARVVPVILRDVDWHSAPFGKLQALPKDGKPVVNWSRRDSAWKNVAQGNSEGCEEHPSLETELRHRLIGETQAWQTKSI